MCTRPAAAKAKNQGGKMNLPFDDQDLPFKDGDILPRPEPGTVLVLKQSTDESGLMLDRGVVTHTYGSLAEDWGSDGESSWAMRDHNDLTGFKGHWYAMIESSDGEDTELVASYEVLALEVRKS
jgi:hypothetical protein